MIGKTIRNARLERGWSTTDLAKAAEITRQHVHNIENDRGDLPLSTAVRLAQVLGLHNLSITDGIALNAPTSSNVDAPRLKVVVAKLSADLNELRSVTSSIASSSERVRDAGSVVSLAGRRNSKKPPYDILRNPPPDAPLVPVDLELEEEVEIHIRGYVAAGQPIDLLTDDLGETRRVPISEAPEPGLEPLVARGDSMIEFGIEDGDIVYVEPRRGGVAGTGEIVIGWLNDGLVIKRWERRGGRKWLVSGNPAYEPREIKKDDSWELQAVVRSRVPAKLRRQQFPNITGKKRRK
jgi:SOS-response transcriptional repressor LexA